MTAQLLALSAVASEAVKLPVVLDGVKTEAWAWRVAPDELLLPIDRVPLMVGDGRDLVIRTEKGRIFFGDRLAGLLIGAKDDAFASLADAEIRGLRGVLLEQWNDAIAARVAAMDFSKAGLSLRSFKTLPALPPAVRWLDVKNTSNMDVKDFSGLANLASLRYLRVETLHACNFDAAWISACTALRFLDLSMEHVENAGRLGMLKELRTLLLAWGEGVTDLSFVKGLPALQDLDVHKSKVADLSTLAGHPSIESINADMTPTSALPAGALRTLRTLRVMSTALSADAIRAFASANPGCRVVHGWDEALRDEVKEADRLRVRSGGTCHRKPEKETTLFEEKEAAAVRALLASIAVDEPESGFHCMCCGEPSIEVYRGDALLATLAVHHGRSIRWSEWPGDALLTVDGSVAVNSWLAKHGVTGPSDEFEKSQAAQRASQRRAERSKEILGAGLYDALRAARSADAIQQAFEGGEPDAVRRARIALELFGCDETSWSIYAAFDEWLQSRVLPGVTPAQIAACLTGGNERVANGAARWFFGEKKLAALDAIHFDGLARRALCHPRHGSRRAALEAIGLLEGDRAVAVLRELLAGNLVPRALAEDEQTEPAGMRRFTQMKLPNASERVLAAHLLARAGDKASGPAIQELAAAAKGLEKAVLLAAAKLLQ